MANDESNGGVHLQEKQYLAGEREANEQWQECLRACANSGEGENESGYEDAYSGLEDDEPVAEPAPAKPEITSEAVTAKMVSAVNAVIDESNPSKPKPRSGARRSKAARKQRAADHKSKRGFKRAAKKTARAGKKR